MSSGEASFCPLWRGLSGEPVKHFFLPLKGGNPCQLVIFGCQLAEVFFFFIVFCLVYKGFFTFVSNFCLLVNRFCSPYEFRAFRVGWSNEPPLFVVPTQSKGPFAPDGRFVHLCFVFPMRGGCSFFLFFCGPIDVLKVAQRCAIRTAVPHLRLTIGLPR